MTYLLMLFKVSASNFRLIGIALSAIVVLSTVTPIFAGPADDAWNAYQTGDFSTAIKIVSTSGSDTTLSNIERSRLYFTLGCVEAMRNRETPAAGAFQRALNLNPDLNIRSEEVPPPIWEIFSSVREKTLAKNQTSDSLSSRGRIGIVSSDPDPLRNSYRMAAIRSITFPGWGHTYLKKERGYYFLSAEAVLLAGWAAVLVSQSDARSDYLDSQTPSDLANNYDRYNRLHKLSWGLGTSTVLVYLAAQFDFFTSSEFFSVTIDWNTDTMSVGISMKL